MRNFGLLGAFYKTLDEDSPLAKVLLVVMAIVELPMWILFAAILAPLFILYILLKLLRIKVSNDFADFICDTAGYPTVISGILGISALEAIINWFCTLFQQ